MKKLLALLLALILCFILVACGSEKSKTCWSCDKTISASASFCEHCGVAVKENREVDSSSAVASDENVMWTTVSSSDGDMPTTVSPSKDEYITFSDMFLENYIKQDLGLSGTDKVSKYDISQLTYFEIKEGITDVQDLQYATNLQTLIFSIGDVNNLETLSTIKTLTHIEFNCDDTYDLSFLRKMVNLEEISIDMRWCSLNGGEWSDLVSPPQLTKLKILDPFGTNKSGYSFLKDATNLNELTLSVEEGTDISVLLDMPNLTEFVLYIGWSGRQPTEHESYICNELIKKGVSVEIG